MQALGSHTIYTGMMRIEHWQAVGKVSYFLYIYRKSVDDDVIRVDLCVRCCFKYNSRLTIYLVVYFASTNDRERMRERFLRVFRTLCTRALLRSVVYLYCFCHVIHKMPSVDEFCTGVPNIIFFIFVFT